MVFLVLKFFKKTIDKACKKCYYICIRKAKKEVTRMEKVLLLDLDGTILKSSCILEFASHIINKGV